MFFTLPLVVFVCVVVVVTISHQYNKENISTIIQHNIQDEIYFSQIFRCIDIIEIVELLYIEFEETNKKKSFRINEFEFQQ